MRVPKNGFRPRRLASVDPLKKLLPAFASGEFRLTFCGIPGHRLAEVDDPEILQVLVVHHRRGLGRAEIVASDTRARNRDLFKRDSLALSSAAAGCWAPAVADERRLPITQAR